MKYVVFNICGSDLLSKGIYWCQVTSFASLSPLNISNNSMNIGWRHQTQPLNLMFSYWFKINTFNIESPHSCSKHVTSFTKIKYLVSVNFISNIIEYQEFSNLLPNVTILFLLWLNKLTFYKYRIFLHQT